MPRATETKAKPHLEVNDMINNLNTWLHHSQYDLGAQFNQTHADYVADKLSDAMGLKDEERLSGRDLIAMTYNELANYDLGTDSAIKTVKLMNIVGSGLITSDGSFSEDYKNQEIDRLINSENNDRLKAWQNGSSALLAGGVTVGGVVTGALIESFALFISCGLLGWLGGGLAGLVIGHCFGTMRNKKAYKNTRKRAVKQITSLEQENRKKHSDRQEHFNERINSAVGLCDDAVFERETSPHAPHAARFKRLPIKM